MLITSGSLTKGGFNKRMMHTKNKLKKEVNELKNELNIQRCQEGIQVFLKAIEHEKEF